MAFGALELLIILLVVGGGILGLIVLAVNSGEGGRILAVVAGIVAVLVVMMIGGVLVMKNSVRSQEMAAMAANEAALMEAQAVARMDAVNSDLQQNAVAITMSYEDVSGVDAEAMTKSFTSAVSQHMAVIEGTRTSNSTATFKGDLSTGEVTAILYPKSSTAAADLDRAISSLTRAVNTELSGKQGFTVSVDSRFNSSQ
jgi:hypothetical protein